MTTAKPQFDREKILKEEKRCLIVIPVKAGDF